MATLSTPVWSAQPAHRIVALCSVYLRSVLEQVRADASGWVGALLLTERAGAHGYCSARILRSVNVCGSIDFTAGCFV